MNGCTVGITQLSSRSHQSVKHRLKVESRTTDDLEHVGGGSLLLQGLAQFIEQSRVLDGDNGLRGEVGKQLNLFIGELTHFSPIDSNCSEVLPLFQHWDDYQAPESGIVHTGYHPRLAIEIGWLLAHIDDVNRSKIPGTSR